MTDLSLQKRSVRDNCQAVRPRASVPGLDRMQEIQLDVKRLQEALVTLADLVLSDARFMDIPVLRVQAAWISGIRGAEPGDLFHIGECVWEGEEAGEPTYKGHPAGESHHPSTAWCKQSIGETRQERYSRRPNREWDTNRGTWVLVGVPGTDGYASFIGTEDAA
ncbi:hypothetical protein ACO03V_14525 [Microbacterium sp. HMH0099]|uniref:hypothetical protein n=1 Tax=Microbacterium sp. HMH0099 TaxID=3414026 RepID=UPI003BF694E8